MSCNNVAKIGNIMAKCGKTLQNKLSCCNFRKGKFDELRKLPEGKFQVNLNKELCLLFRTEPQMKRSELQ